jgi:hypothetical protein
MVSRRGFHKHCAIGVIIRVIECPVPVILTFNMKDIIQESRYSRRRYTPTKKPEPKKALVEGTPK